MKSLQLQVPLSFYTTFRIGGKAQYFIPIQSKDQLTEAVTFVCEKKLPWFVLGEGSNILVSDDGFAGAVFKMEIRGVEWNTISGGCVEVVVGAGERWDDVVALSVERGLFGFENLSGIPGTVGASPVQNIGAYGKEIKDMFSWVEVFDTESMIFKIFQAQDCKFGYRDSIFKQNEGKKYIITRVAFILSLGGVSDISYKDLKDFFAQNNKLNPSTKEVREAVLAIRKSKLPDLSIFGTAGSFFKNPIISTDHHDMLKGMFPTMPSFDTQDGKKKIPAAWILDYVCKYKGYRAGNVGVYEHQPLVLINFSNGTAQEILELAESMRACVKKNTHINLETEVVMLGF